MYIFIKKMKKKYLYISNYNTMSSETISKDSSTDLSKYLSELDISTWIEEKVTRGIQGLQLFEESNNTQNKLQLKIDCSRTNYLITDTSNDHKK
jgi:hypothetical protein